MLRITDTATVTISVLGIEIVALKKLALVNHALASRLSGAARLEQEALLKALDDTVRKIEISAMGLAAKGG
jgi:hypothetical protein